MSPELTPREFALLLDEYVRGELATEHAQACERHLAAHPDARRDVQAATQLLLAPAWRSAGAPPTGLLEDATSSTQRILDGKARRRSRRLERPRSWRPALAWAAVGASVAIALMLAWPNSAPPAFADVLARLRDVDGVQVEGWVRGPDGNSEPWRQWVAADGSFRAEMGAEANRRLVTWHDGVREVRDAAGQLYRLPDPGAGPARREEVQATLRQLEAMARDGSLAATAGEVEREDRGDVTRFTRVARGALSPAIRLRWTLDVDNGTSLPRAGALDQMVAGEWIRTAELAFTAYDTGEAGLFSLEGPAASLTDDDRARLWFELGVSARSLVAPAVTAPAGDSEVKRLGAADVRDGTTGGGYTYHEAGVATFGMYNLTVDNLIRGLAGPSVVDNDVARRRVSLEVRTKEALPWQRKVAAALDTLGLRAEVAPRATTRLRYVFGQDGRAFAASRIEFDAVSVRGDTDGYHYDLERVPLSSAVGMLMGNSSLRRDARDTVIYATPADAARNPFATPVDITFHNRDGSWETNLAFLREQFGITLEVLQDTMTTWEVELIEAPSPRGAKGID